jgi:hypothetical protein
MMGTLPTRHSERSVGPPRVADSEMQDTEGSCIYIKQAFGYSQQGVGLQPAGIKHGDNNSSP